MATDSICTVAAVMCNGSGGGGASATSPTTTHTSQDCSPCSPDTCSTSTNSTVNTTTTATTVDNKQQQHTDDDSQIMFETSSPNANTANDLHTEDDVDDDDVEEDEEEEDNYDDDDDDAVAVVTVEPITKVEVVRDDDDEEVEEEEEAEDYNYDEDGDNNEVGAVPTEIHDEVDTHTDGLSLNEQHMYFDSTESIDDDQSSCRFKVLEYDQLLRLVEVMEATIPIHGRGNFPTLDVKLKDLIQLVRQKLKSEGVHVRDMRLNGGAASYVLEIDTSQSYNDLDLIFGIDLSNQNELQKVKNCVLGCLLDFLPAGVSKDRMSSSSLKEAYVQKMVKVCNEHGDRWSLISLSNKKGKNVELKFVDKMKRQFEFSVDSFQIILDSLLTFYEVSNTPTSEHFYPSVKAESVYGDFSQAWFHLTEKLIATRNPEEIRGGGLLKYCNLLVRRYTPAGNVDIRAMERYMCSRFFIDFSDLSQQKQKLDAYLANHFSGEEDLKYEYLMTLYRVVDDSTICLMGHERRQTLNLIHRLACEIFLEQEQKAQSKYLQLPQFDNSNNLILDQVFYGPYNNTNGGSQYYSYLPFYQVGNTSISSCPLCPQPYLQCS